MLRICISGFTDSGKTTLGDMLAKEMNILHVTKYITDTYKTFKQEDTKKDHDSTIRETANKGNAKPFDDEVTKLSEANNCVVTTWLGPWIVKEPTLRIWLNASPKERVRRCSVEKK